MYTSNNTITAVGVEISGVWFHTSSINIDLLNHQCIEVII